MMATATQWTPHGNLPLPPRADNDNVPMIGLTGKRNVGKSTVARLLVDEYGFVGVHAFEAGKRAAKAWFNALGMPGAEMVYGALKDVPCDGLPDGVPPRYFLERFGKFMGVNMGVDWTLGAEITRARSLGKPIVVESLVYEAQWFKMHGGVVWRIERPGHDGPAGVESDAVQAAIDADVTIVAHDLDQLRRLVEAEMDSYALTGAEINGVAG